MGGNALDAWKPLSSDVSVQTIRKLIRTVAHVTPRTNYVQVARWPGASAYMFSCWVHKLIRQPGLHTLVLCCSVLSHNSSPCGCHRCGRDACTSNKIFSWWHWQKVSEEQVSLRTHFAKQRRLQSKQDGQQSILVVASRFGHVVCWPRVVYATGQCNPGI